MNKYYNLNNLKKQQCINILKDAFERKYDFLMDYLDNESPLRKTCDFLTFNEFIELCEQNNTSFAFCIEPQYSIYISARIMFKDVDYFVWIYCIKDYLEYFEKTYNINEYQ